MEEIRRGYRIKIEESEATEATEGAGAHLLRAADEERTHDVLTVDGKDIPYLKTDQGFRIYYQPPKPDLITAAQSFVDTQPEK